MVVLNGLHVVIIRDNEFGRAGSGLVIDGEHGACGDSVPCSCKHTKVHAVRGYDGGGDIGLVPHCPAHTNPELAVVTPEENEGVPRNKLLRADKEAPSALEQVPPGLTWSSSRSSKSGRPEWSEV